MSERDSKKEKVREREREREREVIIELMTGETRQLPIIVGCNRVRCTDNISESESEIERERE